MATFKSLELALLDFDARYRAAAIDEARKVVQEQANKLNEAVKPWAHKIVFSVKVVARTGFTRFQLIARGDKQALLIFKWVDLGTKPHIIRPKSPNKALVFFTPYSARTAPIANPAAGTGKSGNTKNVRRFVNHPGTEARQFVAFTKLESEEDFKRRMSELITRLGR